MKPLSALFGPPRSLRRKLVINVALAVLFCMALATFVLLREFREHLKENLLASLVHEAGEVAGIIDPDAPDYGLTTASMRFSDPDGKYRYTLFDAQGAALAGGETAPAIAAQIREAPEAEPSMIVLSQGRLGMAVPVELDGQTFHVLASTALAEPSGNSVADLLHEFGEEFHWVLLGILSIIVAAVLATHRSLRPLTAVSRQAHDIGPDTLDRRLATDGLPAEILPLVTAVNGALDRIDQGYRVLRDFSSNVSHEVRTPLAVLRSTIDRIEDATLRASLTEDIGRLDQMFEQLIDLARADALSPATFRAVRLHDLAVDLASEMAGPAVRDGKTLAVTGATQGVAMGHAGLLTIALGNLVRNALTYSPAGTSIEIEVMAQPAGWRVLDRGPGVDDGQKMALFERFNRGAGPAPKAPGSGIGLAIVKSVADAHGAHVSIEDRAGGGSIFGFRFNR